MKQTDFHKRTSLAALLLLLASTLFLLFGFYQTRRQLLSPLISEAIIETISTPFLNLATVSFGAFLISGLLHYSKKYTLSLVLSIAVLSFSYLYLAFKG